MGWKDDYRRIPTWFDIGITLAPSLMMLTLAVLNATRYSEQLVTHGDFLLTVGLAAVGGAGIGAAIEMVRHRAARRQPPATKSATPS
jgi:hypothetical protein